MPLKFRRSNLHDYRRQIVFRAALITAALHFFTQLGRRTVACHQLAKLVPKDADYRHAEGNAAAHIKAVLVGNDVALSIHEGELVLGTWQGIYFAEFDGPRERSATVTVIGD